jgi:hypothetical protein
MTYRGELVNLAHYRLIRIESPGSEAGEFGLLVHVSAAPAKGGASSSAPLRLTDDIPREDAELIMLKIAAGLNAIGYVEDMDKPVPLPPLPPVEDKEEPAPAPKRRGRPRKETTAAAKNGAGSDG